MSLVTSIRDSSKCPTLLGLADAEGWFGEQRGTRICRSLLGNMGIDRLRRFAC